MLRRLVTEIDGPLESLDRKVAQGPGSPHTAGQNGPAEANGDSARTREIKIKIL